MSILNEETIKLILDMGKNGADAKEVATALQQLKTTAKSVGDAYEVVERQVGLYEVMERRVVTTTQEVIAVVSKEQQFYAALLGPVGSLAIKTEELAMATTKVKGMGGSAGYGMLGASYAVQDFTSQLGTRGLGGALGAIQNNIPMLIASLGAGAGLAGTVSIVAVGVGLLYDNWGKLKDYWTGGETEKEAERMKHLAEETDKAREATEALVKTLPQWQRQAGGDIKRAVDSFGGEAVLKELSRALVEAHGDFGKDSNRAQAKTLMTNLMQGDPNAIRLLGDLNTKGDVGEVLRGGKTPEEFTKAADDLNRRREKEKVDFEKAKAQKEADRRKEIAQERAEEKRAEEKGYDDMEEEVRQDTQKRAKESMQLGRSVGKAFEKKNEEAKSKPVKLDKIPMMPLNPDDIQADQVAAHTLSIMAHNQMLITQKLRALDQANRNAMRVNRELVTSTQSPLPK